MAGSDSSSIPADSPILKGVFIILDFKKLETGDNEVFCIGDGSKIFPQCSLFFIWGVCKIKSLGTDFFEVFNTFILFSVKGFFW